MGIERNLNRYKIRGLVLM